MKVTKHKCFKDKLNFWEKVLSTLINLPVDKRCYNLVGSKIVKSNEFIEAIRKECSYEDAKCSTLVEHLTKTILPLGVLLAETYETSASTHYPSTSAEFKSRERFNFIRTEGETCWSDTDTYHGVILFPQVCEISQEILKDKFKFSKAQVQDMDKANDMDGRNEQKWTKLLICLVIDLGFGELLHPELTFAGKTMQSKVTKSTALLEQEAKDAELEAEANKFKDDVEQAEFEDDNDNRISFGGKAISQTERTAAQKRALKRKAGAEARGGASSLNGDQMQQAFNYLTSDERRVEDRAEKQRDREHQERMQDRMQDRIVQQMMYIQQGSSSNSS